MASGREHAVFPAGGGEVWRQKETKADESFVLDFAVVDFGNGLYSTKSISFL